MRRKFKLQMEATLKCDRPEECGTICHCGESVEDHPITDPPHAPVPMYCLACKTELDPFGRLDGER